MELKQPKETYTKQEVIELVRKVGKEIKRYFDPIKTHTPIMHDELGIQTALETRYSAYSTENIFPKVDATVEKFCQEVEGE